MGIPANLTFQLLEDLTHEMIDAGILELCDCCGLLWCLDCREHYADCECGIWFQEER